MRVSTPRDVYGQRYHPYRRDFPYRPEAFTDIGEHGYGGPSLTRCFELRSAQHREGLRLPYDGLGSISTLVLSPIDRDEDVANIDTAVHESGGYSNTEAHGQKVRIRRRSLSSVVIDLALAFRAKCRLGDWGLPLRSQSCTVAAITCGQHASIHGLPMAAPPTPWRSIAPQVPCIRATMSELNDHGYAARMFSALQKQKFGNNMVKMAKVEDDRERLNAEKNSDTSGTNNRVKPEIHGISDRMFQALQSQQYGDSEVALVKMEIERDQLAKELLSREDDVKTLQHQNEELKAHLQAAEIGARNARIYEVELADKNIKIESLEKEVTAEKDANKHLRLSNTELQLANDASIQRITGLETALIIRRKKLTRARDLLKVQRANNADLRTHPSARRHLFSRSEEQQRSRRSRTVDSLMHITFGVQRPRERSPQVTDSSATSTQHVRRSDRADGSDSRDGFQANNATPRSRKQALEKYPQIVVDLNSSHLHESVVFNRTFLSRQLGGNPRRVDVTVKSQTPLSTEFHINKYACPNARDNPWCPTEPGSHGYMFMGLGTDHDVYQTADELHLFVGVNMACYRYMGLYRMQTTAPLTKEEWATLSEKTQKSYSRITETRVFKEVCSEASDPDRVEQIQREYDSGHLLVPCVELVCVDFDYELYERLACIKTTASQAETLSDASHEGDSSYGSKRRRDDEALPSTARKSARLSDGRTRAPSRFLTES